MFEFTWQYFSNLPEIKRLPLHEQKKLFLIEAQNWRDYQNYNMMMANGGPQSNGSTSGIGADGPLNEATVTARGTSVTTNALGEFTFPFELGADEEVTITGGTDSITGVAFEGELKGYITPTVKVVSPLTTIAYYDEDAATFDEALDNVITAAETAGFTGIDKTILTEDYVKKSIVENDDRAVALQAFTTYVDSMAEAAAPSLVGLATSQFGTPSNVKQAKINLYKYFGRTRTFSAKSFIQAERFELDETKTTILNSATTAVESVLKEELLSVVKDSLADSNYRTTRIQTINRAIKQDIKAQIVKAENDRDATVVKTDSADVLGVVNSAASSLSRLETTQENVTERTTDDTKTTKLTDVTSLFASGDKTGLFFISSQLVNLGPFPPQNIYALTTDLQVGTKLFVKDVEADTFRTMDETVNITIKGVVVKTVGWVLANQANTYSDSAKYVSLTSSDGNTTYTVGLDGTIKEILEIPVEPPTPPTSSNHLYLLGNYTFSVSPTGISQPNQEESIMTSAIKIDGDTRTVTGLSLSEYSIDKNTDTYLANLALAPNRTELGVFNLTGVLFSGFDTQSLALSSSFDDSNKWFVSGVNDRYDITIQYNDPTATIR